MLRIGAEQRCTLAAELIGVLEQAPLKVDILRMFNVLIDFMAPAYNIEY
jgi:hypothetical protein